MNHAARSAPTSAMPRSFTCDRCDEELLSRPVLTEVTFEGRPLLTAVCRGCYRRFFAARPTASPADSARALFVVGTWRTAMGPPPVSVLRNANHA